MTRSWTRVDRLMFAPRSQRCCPDGQRSPRCPQARKLSPDTQGRIFRQRIARDVEQDPVWISAPPEWTPRRRTGRGAPQLAAEAIWSAAGAPGSLVGIGSGLEARK
jgi:hypothetical protein